MSGPSSEQLQLQQEQMDFYKEGMQHSQQVFAQQQGLLKQMEDVYGPVLKAGPSQEGFAPEEKQNLEGQIIQGTATNYAHAATATNERLAAEGGSNPLTGGTEEELRQEVANAAAGEESNLQSQVLEQDYATGRQNFNEATAAIETAAGDLNPVAYSNATTGAGTAAENTAQQINQEQNSWEAPVFGAIGALGGAALGNPKIFG